MLSDLRTFDVVADLAVVDISENSFFADPADAVGDHALEQDLWTMSPRPLSQRRGMAIAARQRI